MSTVTMILDFDEWGNVQRAVYTDGKEVRFYVGYPEEEVTLKGGKVRLMMIQDPQGNDFPRSPGNNLRTGLCASHQSNCTWKFVPD